MPSATTIPLKKKAKKKIEIKPKVSYHRKPDDLSLDQWQAALRKQFAETKSFTVVNEGGSVVFSDYHVYNPETKNTYKVAIRGAEPGLNFCSCMDFKTNQLGTCKHIEYILFQISQRPRQRKVLSLGHQPHYTSVFLKYGKERKVCLRIGTENTEVFQKSAKNYFDEEGALKEHAYIHIETFLEKAHSLHPDFRCYTDALQFILEKRETQKRNEVVDKALKEEDGFINRLIKGNLFAYQKQGIEFALRKGRCLLADDMGLGKTIQAIGAAEGMKKLFGISKVLIVCPTSLKYQWKSEIEKFSDSDLCVVEGKLFEREIQYANDKFYKICSYNVVGRDIEYINKNAFDLVILDEAQRVKNWQAATSKNIKKVKSNYALVLTGTPLENKLEELYSVVQVVDPFQLGALFRFVHQHQITEEATGKVIGYKDLNKIGELLQNIMLRRHKRDVLTQLPSRQDKNLFVPMTDKQLEYYADAYDNVCKLVNKWIRYKFLNEKDRQRLLINLNLMRMSCDSTFVVDEKTRHDTKIDELMNILDGVFENGDDKVVIFSQWERMTRIVGQELDARKIKYENLNGSVPSKEREVLFKNFNNDPESKIFLSTDAGGVGLNLQAASYLINLDLPWNPAVLEQRIGRIHRMGQKKNVQIINLITANSIEEQMLSKLKFKSSMATGVLDNGESTVFLGESKFNELMKTVKSMTDASSQIPVPVTEKEDTATVSPTVQEKIADVEAISQNGKEVKQPSLFENISDNGSSEEIKSVVTAETETLLQHGTDFFGKLFETLNDETKTKNLLQDIIKTDSSTGQSYLQIPVKNAEAVGNGLKLLGQLLSGLK